MAWQKGNSPAAFGRTQEALATVRAGIKEVSCMTTTVSYSYCVIRYVHDAGGGERLNVGVVFYSPSVPFLGFLFEPHFERLSRTFSNFNGDQYKEVLRHFE